MTDKFEELSQRMRELEKELAQEARKREIEFRYQLHEKRIRFTEEAKAVHRKFVVGVPRFLQKSRLAVTLTAPVIWMCFFPIVLTDLIGTLYQAICFPIYGIPKVRRSDYLAFDRHFLGYLNAIEKLNCEYCAYANGILGYFTEIAARTEQYWCPIKHARCLKCVHSRYGKFLPFGDAEAYRGRLEEVRRSFQDIDPKAP
jgi:hypothetical protein